MKCLMLFLLAALMQAAMAASPGPVRLSLLSDHSAVAADEAFRVGVRFVIEPGWHTYWKNPGDSGLAPTVKWDLPAGFKASELQWPTPRLFMLPGEVRNIGYAEEVMLIAEIRPPLGWHGPTVIAAEVQWMACKETCVAGGQTIRTSVDVGGAAVLSNTETFVTWQGRMPQRVTAAAPLEGVQVEHVGRTYLVRVHEDGAIGEPAIFISAPADAGVRAGVREQKSNEATVEVTVAPKAASAGSGEVGEVVVSWSAPSGAPRSVVVPLSSKN